MTLYCRVMIESTTRGLVYRKDFEPEPIFTPLVQAFASALVSRQIVQEGEHYRALIVPGYGEATLPHGTLSRDPQKAAEALPAWLNLLCAGDGLGSTTPLSYFTLELRFVESGLIYRQDLDILALDYFWSNVQTALVRMRVLQHGDLYYPQLFICADDQADFEHEEVQRLPGEGDSALVEVVAVSAAPELASLSPEALPVIGEHSVTLIGAQTADEVAHQDALRIYITQDALAALEAIARAEVDVEQGGMLVGQVYRNAAHPDGYLVVITDYLVAEGTHASLVELRYTFESWAHSTAQLRERFPGKRIVGWYHTHLVHLTVRDADAPEQTTRTELFFSSDDLFMHRQFFREPWHVAMVLGQPGHAVFYRWFGETISANATFYILPPEGFAGWAEAPGEGRA